MLRRVLVTGAACLALSATASAAAPHPSLSARGRHTLTVTGRHFRAGEKVRVVLNVARHKLKHARASGRGTFSVTYHDVPLGPCDGYAIMAVGDGGSRATLARMRPDCLVR
jgi:hypothetical protein